MQISHRAKHFTSILAAGFFLFMGAASSRVNKIHCGTFNTIARGEDVKEKRNFVELNDGNRIYGEDISWKTGIIVKDQVKIDGQKFAIKETRGYFSNGEYYGRIINSYAKRIIRGKLNVYYTEDVVTSTDSKGYTSQRRVCYHYIQNGDEGELKAIGNQEDIKKYVKDCPKSLEMISKKDKEIRRSIRKDPLYFNDIFTTYNNNCQ